MEFSKSAAPFRNWALGQNEDAGAWGRDEIRNLVGDYTARSDTGVIGHPTFANGVFAAGTASKPYQPQGQGGTAYDLSFDASRVVPTGPMNVPPHVWQPVIIYLGGPDRR